MKILITGASGQLGWELTQQLRRAQSEQQTLALASANILALNREQLDLSNPDSICERIREIKPQVILNAAAYTAVDKAETEQDAAMRINGIAPGILAEEANRLNALLVHYSTDYVFPGNATKPYKETDPTGPVSVYGATKLAGEQAITDVAGRHAILRTSWLYGNRGQNFFLTMLRLANEREQLSVVGDQCGAPTWVRYVAETTLRAIDFSRHGELRLENGIYHLTASGETSWHGFASAIFAHAHDPARRLKTLHSITTAQYPTAARRPRYSVLSNAKIAAALTMEVPDWQRQLIACLASRAAGREAQ